MSKILTLASFTLLVAAPKLESAVAHLSLTVGLVTVFTIALSLAAKRVVQDLTQS